LECVDEVVEDECEVVVEECAVVTVSPLPEPVVVAAAEPATDAPATSADTVALNVPVIPVNENLAENDW